MNDFLYLLSSSFDYSKMICADNGPDYAVERGWNYQTMGNEIPKDKILIFDNRIQETDVSLINKIIQNSGQTIVFKLIDGMEEALKSFNNRFLLSIVPQKNIFFYSPYQSSYIFEKLRKKHGDNKCYVLPYAYNPAKERVIDFEKKKNKLIVTGSLSQYAYPLRWHVHISTFKKLWAICKVNYLSHPGYPDIGFKPKHDIVGDKYIDYLSKYFFMLVTCSKWDYELLKFRECAYAGCYPVGNLPSSIKLTNKEDYKSFFDIQTDIKNALIKLFELPLEVKINNILAYRNWFRQNRNSNVLNQGFYQFITHAR